MRDVAGSRIRKKNKKFLQQMNNEMGEKKRKGERRFKEVV